MSLTKSSHKSVGVIGAGSFGTVVANILSEKSEVILYARNPATVDLIKNEGVLHQQQISPGIKPTSDLEYISERCDILFPVIPSASFRDLMRKLSPYLHPYHILIHGTKGLDLSLPNDQSIDNCATLSRDQVKTMSEVIQEESAVVRIGCLAGPNLAKEMAMGQPAATVVASQFQEVIEAGKKLLKNDRFQVYGNSDLIGIELCGVLKNIIAIAAGALSGLGLGENARALLISRGMVEMIHLGRALGGNVEAFVGLAGVGDLIATCSTSLSRNFTVGERLAKGESLNEIMGTMEELAEGVNTTKIARKLAAYYSIRAPITEALYRVMNSELTAAEALNYLMRYPLSVDIDFL